MTRNPVLAGALIGSLLFLTQCDTQTSPERAATSRKDRAASKENEQPPAQFSVTYHPMPLRDSGMVKFKRDFTAQQRAIIYAINRIDAGNIRRKDTLVVPDSLGTDIMAYSPFPAVVPFLKDVHKIVIFSYPIQAFAAYEAGRLVRWGPSSMGKKATPTPTGLFFANWKAKETVSTVKDEWVLKWNFNIQNREGVGWHLYAMPGYPASHSCLRLLEGDARFLYGWADQWQLEGTDNILANGTPTVVYGAYPWGKPRPWKALLSDPKANQVTPEQLQQEVESFLPKIMAAQQKRDQLAGSDKDTVGDKQEKA